MNATRCKQKTPVLDSVLSLKGSHSRRLSLTDLSLNEDECQNDSMESFDTLIHGGINISDDNNMFGNSGHGSSARSFSSSSSSSSSWSSPLWSPSRSVSRSQAAIPFSWEDKPGVPKQPCIRRLQTIPAKINKHGIDDYRVELRPPPLLSGSAVHSRSRSFGFPIDSFQDQQHCSRRGRRPKKIDDPFLTALVECTKQGINDVRVPKQRYSCMNTCSVRDALVTVPRSKLVSSSHKELTHPQTWKQNGLVVPSDKDKARSKECKSHNGTAHHHSLTTQKKQHLFYYAMQSDNGLSGNGDPDQLFRAAERDLKAFNQQKQPLGFMQWVSCTDAELYQSLLHP